MKSPVPSLGQPRGRLRSAGFEPAMSDDRREPGSPRRDAGWKPALLRRPPLRRLGSAGAALAGLFCLAAASDPSERLREPAQEARARALFVEIRCVQCQSESIDDSEAPIASDLRRVVREQVATGRTDAEIKRYLVDRYGEFVLLRPSFSWVNALLWLGPLLVAGGAGAVLVVRAARARPEPVPPLSPAEEARLRSLTGGHAFAAPDPHENTNDDLSVS